VKWYADGWIDCWNSNRPERVRDILTEDFVLDSPTTRHTGWRVQGYQATMDYIRYVLTAYPDLKWEVTEPPMFSDRMARAAFTWRGTGTSPAASIRPALQAPGGHSNSRDMRCSISAAIAHAGFMPPTTCSA